MLLTCCKDTKGTKDSLLYDVIMLDYQNVTTSRRILTAEIIEVINC